MKNQIDKFINLFAILWIGGILIFLGLILCNSASYFLIIAIILLVGLEAKLLFNFFKN